MFCVETNTAHLRLILTYFYYSSMCVCKCDVCSRFNYYINMVSESVNKRFIYRSVITVDTNLFAKKNCKLHTFATTNSNSGKITYFRHMLNRITSMYIKFQQNRVS